MNAPLDGRTSNKVLIVDDEKQVLTALTDALEENFTVVTTDDPGAALEIIARDRELSVVISDQRMGRMNGYELLAKARDCSDATRILITGFSDLDAVIKAVNEGRIFSYLSKPWDNGHLRMMVSRAAEYFALKQKVLYEQDLLHSLMENLPDSIYFKDLEHRYVRVNNAHARLLGFNDPSELRGKRVTDYLNSEQIEEIRNVELAVLRTGEPAIDEVHQVFHALDGEERCLSFTRAPTRDSAGQISGLVAVGRDVSARVRIEQDLREREAALRHAERLARLGHRYWDQKQSRFESPSANLYQIIGLGTEVDTMTLEDWLSRVHDEDRGRLRDYYERASREPGQVETRYRIRCGDGKLVHIQELIEPVNRGDGGQLWFSTLQDVSLVVGQQQELQLLLATTRALAESRTEEEALDRVLGELAEVMGWHYGEVWMLGPSGDLVCQPSRYLAGEHLQPFRRVSESLKFKPGHGCPGEVWQTGKFRIYDNLDGATSPEFLRLDEAKRSDITSAAYFPVIRPDGSPLAVLGFARAGGAPVEESAVATVMVVASQIGAALERLDAIQAVQDRDLRFRSLAANLPGIIFSWIRHPDGETEMQYISPKAVAAWAPGSAMGTSSPGSRGRRSYISRIGNVL